MLKLFYNVFYFKYYVICNFQLNTFRTLLNSKSKPMTKTFREANPSMERSLFHVCPSGNTTHLLLPGCVDPPGQVLIVGYTMVSGLDQSQTTDAFNRGDTPSDDVLAKLSEQKQKTTVNGVRNGVAKKGQIESDKRNVLGYNQTTRKPNSRSSVDAKRDSGIAVSNMKASNEVQRVKLEKKDHAVTRKLLEKQRKEQQCRTPTPQSVRLSAATVKRMQDRNTTEAQQNKDAKCPEKAVCVHTDLSDSEVSNPISVKSPPQRSPSTLSLTSRNFPTLSPSPTTECHPTNCQVAPPHRPDTGRVVRGRSNKKRNRRSGCL